MPTNTPAATPEPQNLEDAINYINANLFDVKKGLFSKKNPYLNTEAGKAFLAYYSLQTLSMPDGDSMLAIDYWTKTYRKDLVKSSVTDKRNAASDVVKKYTLSKYVLIDLNEDALSLQIAQADQMFTYGHWHFGLAKAHPKKLFELEATYRMGVHTGPTNLKLRCSHISSQKIKSIVLAAICTENSYLRSFIVEHYQGPHMVNFVLEEVLNSYHNTNIPREKTITVLAAIMGEPNLNPAVADLLACSNLSYSEVCAQLITHREGNDITSCELPTLS